MERFTWTDIETTGLSPKDEQVVEVGFRITDLELRTLDEVSVLIWSESHEKAAENAIPLVKKMHAESKAFEDARANGVSPEEAFGTLERFLEYHKIGREDPLCGSSVQFDREFLRYHFPSIEVSFSYRNVDNSTVKELCRRKNPVLYSKLEEDTKPKKLHRVLPDLTDTINEARFYMDNFLWVA
jgi:oligoribonuclease